MKEWLSAKEIADLALPGFPLSKRQINRLALSQGWATRRDINGAGLARRRFGVRGGGGMEYHASLLQLPMGNRSTVVVSEVTIDGVAREQQLRRVEPSALIARLEPDETLHLNGLAKRLGLRAELLVLHFVRQGLALAEVKP